MKKEIKSNCEMCEYYIYDDEYDSYYCDMELDEDEMYDVAIHIMKEKMSVRDVEKYIRELNGQDNKKKKDKVEKDPVVLDLEHRLSEKLATQVEIGKNKMTIAFHDTKDLNRILEILDCLDKGI